MRNSWWLCFVIFFFQAYSQTDLCFYIADLLQKNTPTNEKRRLPGLAFSAVLGVVQTKIPSGVGAIQELIGDSKELEKTTRMYYAFVWSTTFQFFQRSSLHLYF